MKYDLPALKVIGASQIEQWLAAHPRNVFEVVRNTYAAHSRGETICPDSYFLRFPDSANRIIALPSSIESGVPITGIKWISSFPDNVERGLDRASALLIVNDRQTGYPRACMEGSLISAARTAASACVGAHFLHPTPGRINRVGVVGCGIIAYRSVELLHRLGWQIGGANITDLSVQRAEQLRDKCLPFMSHMQVTDLRSTIAESDLIIFATSASEPYMNAHEWMSHAPTILNMSLRDLAVNVIVRAQNVADDVDHCLQAGTSLHRAFQTSGSTSFIDGDIAAAIAGHIKPDPSRHRIFSPFGMGILDLAIAREILQDLDASQVTSVPGFFPVPFAA